MITFDFATLTNSAKKCAGKIKEYKWLLVATTIVAYKTHDKPEEVDAEFGKIYEALFDRTAKTRFMKACRDYATAHDGAIAELQQKAPKYEGFLAMVAKQVELNSGNSLTTFRDQGKRMPSSGKASTTPGSAAGPAVSVTPATPPTAEEMQEAESAAALNAQATMREAVAYLSANLADIPDADLLSLLTALTAEQRNRTAAKAAADVKVQVPAALTKGKNKVPVQAAA